MNEDLGFGIRNDTPVIRYDTSYIWPVIDTSQCKLKRAASDSKQRCKKNKAE